jgi:hypothetical protein
VDKQQKNVASFSLGERKFKGEGSDFGRMLLKRNIIF